MVKAFSLAEHDFTGVTSCSQQTPLMAAVSYQSASSSSSSSPVVVEKALTRHLGTERMKKKRKIGHNYDPGMDTVLANNTCTGKQFTNRNLKNTVDTLSIYQSRNPLYYIVN